MKHNGHGNRQGFGRGRGFAKGAIGFERGFGRRAAFNSNIENEATIVQNGATVSAVEQNGYGRPGRGARRGFGFGRRNGLCRFDNRTES